MTASLAEIETSTRHLADEVEAWLAQITPANPLPASPVAVPGRGTGIDIAALVAAGLAEVERNERATAAAQNNARPTLLERLTRRHLRPAHLASVHIRRAAAVLATAGWCRGELTDASGRHCILGALQAVAAEADTALRSHVHIRAAMTEPASYARPSDAYLARLDAEARACGMDPADVRRRHDIAVANNIGQLTVGAVLELLERAAVIAESAGD
ncbi:hypothetical protein [Streptomyces sp. A1136]|uniref:DUF6197 family protein n=1 Tax=Streptomyces sp. A1136 TaxID=2563102 RepID=UPI00109ED0C5|nr:hypothetical protein [Streptomyces sp. A1136]THA47462.1 hypothetical protein E6R62_31090 [Streptomyces sp. A1136]